MCGTYICLGLVNVSIKADSLPALCFWKAGRSLAVCFISFHAVWSVLVSQPEAVDSFRRLIAISSGNIPNQRMQELWL